MTEEEAEEVKVLKARLAQYEKIVQERNHFASLQRFLDTPSKVVFEGGFIDCLRDDLDRKHAISFQEIMALLGFDPDMLKTKLCEAASVAANQKDREAKAV